MLQIYSISNSISINSISKTKVKAHNHHKIAT